MPVSEFIALYDNPKTKYNYLLAAATYLKFICGDETLTTKDIKRLDTCAKTYLASLKKERDLFYDLKHAANAYAGKYAPKTARLNLTIIILWLEDNGHKLTRRERKRIFQSLPAPQPVRKDADLTPDLFRKTGDHLPPWAQTLLTLLAGTGMRIGEALLLETRDLDNTGQRTTARIRAENAKTKTERVVILTREAAEALDGYLCTRTDNDARLFPYSAAQAQYVLRKARAHMGRDGNYFRWHAARKWFLSQFRLCANRAVGEMLAGHSGYLDTAYRRYTLDTAMGEFIKAEPFIQIQEIA